MQGFQLHHKLQQDTIPLASLGLSDLLLMNDSRYPWLILVPRVPEITEIYQLEKQDQIQLIEEINHCSEGLTTLYQPDKINVAALGNVVSQLHIHVVARFQSDETWPGPIWGQGTAQPYTESEITSLKKQLQTLFSKNI